MDQEIIDHEGEVVHIHPTIWGSDLYRIRGDAWDAGEPEPEFYTLCGEALPRDTKKRLAPIAHYIENMDGMRFCKACVDAVTPVHLLAHIKL